MRPNPACLIALFWRMSKFRVASGPAPNLPSVISRIFSDSCSQLRRATNSIGVSPFRLVCGRDVL